MTISASAPSQTLDVRHCRRCAVCGGRLFFELETGQARGGAKLPVGSALLRGEWWCLLCSRSPEPGQSMPLVRKARLK